MTDAFAKATGHNSGTSQTEQDEARKFLFDRHGAWARARQQVCALAGIDEQALTEKLKSKPSPDGDPMAARRESEQVESSLPTANELPDASRRVKSDHTGL